MLRVSPETQRFAISFRDFVRFSAELAVRVAILNLRFENAAIAIAILWDAKDAIARQKRIRIASEARACNAHANKLAGKICVFLTAGASS